MRMSNALDFDSLIPKYCQASSPKLKAVWSGAESASAKPKIDRHDLLQVDCGDCR